MKKGKKLLMSALVAAFSLTAFAGCGLLGGLTDDEGGTESLQYTMEETQQKINKIATSTGLEIKVKFYDEDFDDTKESGETLFGMKDNTYWTIEDDGYGYAYVISEDKTSAVYYDFDGETWEYDYTIDLSNLEDGIDGTFGFSSWLYFGHVYDGMLKKSGSTKIAGRDCDLYKYSINLLIEKVEYTLAVDKETGATMKFDLGANIMGESGRTGFEITTFKTSGVTAPDLPAPAAEWPTNTIFPEPYGCTIISVRKDGRKNYITVEWESKEAAKDYIECVKEVETDAEVIGAVETEEAVCYGTYGITITSMNEEENIVLYK